MAKKEDGPDQARSWAIAMAGCVINSLLSGVSRATGLFYVSLIETYGVSRMEANMPFTMRNVVRNLASPVTGAIGQRYGAKVVTFIGGIFACLGISLCYFAPNVVWISVIWGGMHGLGVALGNTLFPVIVNQYFLKYRATASGLSLSGACVGSFILPVIVEYMLRNFGLPGTFLITGGFILHVLPAALLMTEPSWIKRSPVAKQKSVSGKENHRIKSISPASNLEKIREGIAETASLKSTPSSAVISGEKKTDEDYVQSESRRASVFRRNGVDNLAFVDSKIDKDNVQPESRRASVFSRSAVDILAFMDSKTDKDNVQSESRRTSVFSQNGVDNLAFMGSKTDINERNTQLIQEEFQGRRMRTISIGESSIVVPEPLGGEIQETSLTKATAILIFNPMFHVIGISLAAFAMLFDPAITVIVDYIIDKGLQENDAKYFISMMSLGDLLGRLCFGWVTDKKYMTVPKFMLLLQVIQGICFLLLPLFQVFEILIAIIMIYGLASGANLVMFPILVSKYLESVQSLAIGSISVFTGVTSFAVPPLIGYFRDNTGSYDGMFFITGGLSVIIGCLWFFEPLFVRLHNSRRSASVTINS